MRISSNPETFSRDVCIGGEMNIRLSHRKNLFSTNLMHSHDFCELVMYTEGRKSVYVNDSIYISDIGCAFTFRPGERHFGMHHEGTLHERYMAQFAPNCLDGIPGGRALLDCFFDREAGKNNMIILPEDAAREGFRLLDGIIALGEGDDPAREALMLAGFMQYLALLCRYYRANSAGKFDLMPALLREMISHIDGNLRQPLRVAELCGHFGISISTAERLLRMCWGCRRSGLSSRGAWSWRRCCCFRALR